MKVLCLQWLLEYFFKIRLPDHLVQFFFPSYVFSPKQKYSLNSVERFCSSRKHTCNITNSCRIRLDSN